MEDKCIIFENAPLSEAKQNFHEAQKYIFSHESTCDINLDSALDELDMLSTITPSRLDYLKEQTSQVKKKRSSNSLSSAPLCVVQMNSDFVTKFSLSKSPSSITDCESPDESQKTDLMCKRKNKRKVTRKFTPYNKNVRRQNLRAVESEPHTALTEAIPPPIVTRQDSGNKSNPSSPVKSQNSSISVGCSIFRSRSLDDLEISKLNLNGDCCDITSHGEIDTVSQRISKLQVS